MYLWVFAVDAHARNARLDVLAILVTVLSVLLSFNFACKGGYRGVKDYQWEVVRSHDSAD